MDLSALATLHAVKDDGMLTIRLNRPAALNAISPELATELSAVLAHVRSSDDVRVVVITGEGRAFSAGGDIELDAVPVSRMSAWDYRRNVEHLSEPIVQIAELDRPVIAAVNGIAVGGGWDLALACDIRIASAKARFKDAYVQLGVLPELGGTYFLPRLAGLGRAKMISFTGDFVTAEEALRWGLVEQVVPAEELDSTVAALARRISRSPAKAIAMTKLAMNRSVTSTLAEALDYAKAISPALISSPDFREAVAAFIEKREPTFNG